MATPTINSQGVPTIYTHGACICSHCSSQTIFENQTVTAAMLHTLSNGINVAKRKEVSRFLEIDSGNSLEPIVDLAARLTKYQENNVAIFSDIDHTILDCEEVALNQIIAEPHSFSDPYDISRLAQITRLFFYVTARPQYAEAFTIKQLTDSGFPVPQQGLFLGHGFGYPGHPNPRSKADLILKTIRENPSVKHVIYMDDRRDELEHVINALTQPLLTGELDSALFVCRS